MGNPNFAEVGIGARNLIPGVTRTPGQICFQEASPRLISEFRLIATADLGSMLANPVYCAAEREFFADNRLPALRKNYDPLVNRDEISGLFSVTAYVARNTGGGRNVRLVT